MFFSQQYFFLTGSDFEGKITTIKLIKGGTYDGYSKQNELDN